MLWRLRRLFRKLRNAFGGVVERDEEARYRARLQSELARVEESLSGPYSPVLIHTIGKVGSTAVSKAVAEVPGFVVFQTHFVSDEGVAAAREVHRGHRRDPVHLQVGERVMERIRKGMGPGKLLRVVTLMRDPVARAVSDLFENPDLLSKEGVSDLNALPLEEVVALAAGHVPSSLRYTEAWFDREISGVFGFDFFGEAFDRERGFSMVELEGIRILVGKLERLSKSGPAALGEFLGLGRELEIPKRRARSATGEASLYDEVRAKIKLPAALLDEVYGSRVSRHFYTGEEIAGFRSHWE